MENTQRYYNCSYFEYPKNPHDSDKEINNEYGYMPLHFACSKGAPLELISALLDAWPDDAEQKDKYDLSMPLHAACNREVPFGFVSALLHAWPAAAKQKDTHGSMPLLRACHKESPFEVISALLND
eukprot:5211087-Ditylum_brightwellii.AAC.1